MSRQHLYRLLFIMMNHDAPLLPFISVCKGILKCFFEVTSLYSIVLSLLLLTSYYWS